MNDYNKDTHISDLNSPLTLRDVSDQSPEQTFKNAILKINDLIKTKYSLVKKEENKINNQLVKNFIDIKRSAGQLNNNIKQQTLQIKNSIESQKTELKKLYDEEIIFDQNKRNELHVSIISSQKTLIEDYKEKNYQLTLNLKNSEKRRLEIDRSFKTNNGELKNTLSRYIVNSKKIQEKLNLVEESKNLKLEKEAKQVKFYQDENIRLSSELLSTQKKNEITKENLNNIEIEKEKISNKIKDLNKSIEEKTNIISSPLIRDTSDDAKKNVDKLVLLNPNFSSITKVLYILKGILIISVIIDNRPKKRSPVIILPYPTLRTN